MFRSFLSASARVASGLIIIWLLFPTFGQEQFLVRPGPTGSLLLVALALLLFTFTLDAKALRGSRDPKRKE